MAPTVADIMALMQALAPRDLAETWDNVGLQVGDPRWPAEKIRLALDPLPQVVDDAVRDGVQMLITHHPLIFKPISSVSVATPLGKVIHTALANRLAIFSAHTNLDSARGGVNDVLARRLGIGHLSVLGHEIQTQAVKLTVFVPQSHEAEVLSALVAAGAGRIGDYSGCTFAGSGKATFTPGPLSRPFMGEPEQASRIDEVRMETRVTRDRLEAVIAALKKAHPYETVAYDLYPVQPEPTGQGLGRVGDLDPPRSLEAFAGSVRRRLGLASVRVVGDDQMVVGRVAVCSGSGGGLLGDVFAACAQVYVSGDLRYHEARDAQAKGVGLIDIGHFAGEHLVLGPLAEQLASAADHAGWSVSVRVCEAESDPFRIM